eukprot:6190682-Pleurochrysis_carterae.AAC.2
MGERGRAWARAGEQVEQQRESVSTIGIRLVGLCSSTARGHRERRRRRDAAAIARARRSCAEEDAETCATRDAGEGLAERREPVPRGRATSPLGNVLPVLLIQAESGMGE